MRAAGHLAEATGGTYACRCSRCGYPLDGLCEPPRCPECGLERAEQADPQRRPPPWADRDRIGWLRAWWRTAWAVLRRPTRFFERLEVLRAISHRIGEPFAATLVVLAICCRR